MMVKELNGSIKTKKGLYSVERENKDKCKYKYNIIYFQIIRNY